MAQRRVNTGGGIFSASRKSMWRHQWRSAGGSDQHGINKVSSGMAAYQA